MEIKVVRNEPINSLYTRYHVRWHPENGVEHEMMLNYTSAFALLTGLHSMEYLGATQDENDAAAHRYLDDADHEHNKGHYGLDAPARS